MFFATQLIDGLQVRINESAEAIARLEEQLRIEREAKQALELELQAMLTKAQAGESAIEQMQRFLELCRASGDVAMEASFWEFVDGMRGAPRGVFAGEPQPEPSPSDNGQDVRTTVVDDESQVVTAKNVTEAIFGGSETVSDGGSDEYFLSYKELMGQDYELLKTIAEDWGVPNGSKTKVCSGLKGKVTATVLDEFLAKMKG